MARSWRFTSEGEHRVELLVQASSQNGTKQGSALLVLETESRTEPRHLATMADFEDFKAESGGAIVVNATGLARLQLMSIGAVPAVMRMPGKGVNSGS